MLNFAIPVIERLANENFCQVDISTLSQIQERRKIAEAVKQYFDALKSGNRNIEMSNEYYAAIAKLLGQEEYERIVLYFPLSDLKGAPQYFKDAYMNAWYHLLNHCGDYREDFYEGDYFEPEARPDGRIEPVIKCIHLTPWLLEAGYVSYTDIKRVLEIGKDNSLLLQNFAETWEIISDRELLTVTQLKILRAMTANVPPRKKLEPLFITEKRAKWLAEKARKPSPLVTPDANLAGPFSQNLGALREDLEMIQSNLGPEKIVLVTGSRLKGYGTQDSDWDVFKLEDLESDQTMCPGRPRAAFLYFDAIWLGGCEVRNLAEIAMQKASKYFGESDRILSVLRMEMDLLQYRLLHKGFKIFYSSYDSVAKNYPEIDGDCPFYDDKYRRIATEIYATYIFIPSLKF